MVKLSPKLSFKEEVANSISHGIGSIAMIVLLPISATYTYVQFGIKNAISISIFIISLFLMFLASTLYHAMAYDSPHKKVFRAIDHSMIFIAIAGSYTPVALALIDGIWGIVIISIQWGITLFGILYKIFSKQYHEKLGLALYLVMGWLVIFIVPTLIQKTTLPFMVLLVIGGLCYTVGALFYAKKKPYFHVIWHMFILIAAICQYIAIVYFMI